jgi:hypothetical protein
MNQQQLLQEFLKNIKNHQEKCEKLIPEIHRLWQKAIKTKSNIISQIKERGGILPIEQAENELLQLYRTILFCESLKLRQEDVEKNSIDLLTYWNKKTPKSVIWYFCGRMGINLPPIDSPGAELPFIKMDKNKDKHKKGKDYLSEIIYIYLLSLHELLEDK